jgi:hypothetical protein
MHDLCTIFLFFENFVLTISVLDEDRGSGNWQHGRLNKNVKQTSTSQREDRNCRLLVMDKVDGKHGLEQFIIVRFQMLKL